MLAAWRAAGVARPLAACLSRSAHRGLPSAVLNELQAPSQRSPVDFNSYLPDQQKRKQLGEGIRLQIQQRGFDSAVQSFTDDPNPDLMRLSTMYNILAKRKLLKLILQMVRDRQVRGADTIMERLNVVACLCKLEDYAQLDQEVLELVRLDYVSDLTAGSHADSFNNRMTELPAAIMR